MLCFVTRIVRIFPKKSDTVSSCPTTRRRSAAFCAELTQHAPVWLYVYSRTSAQHALFQHFIHRHRRAAEVARALRNASP